MEMKHKLLLDSNMFNVGAIQHAPVVKNAQNVHMYVEEHTTRFPDNTNTVEDAYEYAQPKSYRIVANNNFQVNNPFGSPCQVCLLYAQVADATAYLALTFDNNDMSALSLTTNITDFPGILLTQTGNAPLAPIAQWIDFQQFVQIRAQGITTVMEWCLIFRRKVHQIIPQNTIPFNSLDQ